MPTKIYTSAHAPTHYGSLCENDTMIRKAIDTRIDEKITCDLIRLINDYNDSHSGYDNVLPAALRNGVVFAETKPMDAEELDWYDSDGEPISDEPFGFTQAYARDAVHQMYDRIITHGGFDDLLYTGVFNNVAYFIMPEQAVDSPGATTRSPIAKFFLRFLDESEVFTTELSNNDDTKKMLEGYCDSIVESLKGAYRDEVCEELGYTRNEDDEWVDADGDELELDSNGYPVLEDGTYASKYLSDCYDIKVIVDLHDTSDVYGARIMVAGGGPNIYIDTSENTVEGYWGSTKVVRCYTDEIGLDDEIEYMAENFLN